MKKLDKELNAVKARLDEIAILESEDHLKYVDSMGRAFYAIVPYLELRKHDLEYLKYKILKAKELTAPTAIKESGA